MPAPAWTPPDDAMATTRVGRFMGGHGVADIDALRHRSVAEPEWFWDAVVHDLGIQFSNPYDRVLDTSNGIPWATWFVGGRLNLSLTCLDRHPPQRPALTWEGEDGEVRMWTYGELLRQAEAFAALLLDRGVKAGEHVGIFCPMVPETVAALLGTVRIGAVFLPLFSGYGGEAVAGRLADAGAVALVTADGTWRRGKPL